MQSDEAAKVIQETAKATGTLANLAGKVGGFISMVIGGASNQVGGVLEDWTRFYRYKNLLSIADKVEAIHTKRKISGKTNSIPPRLAIPMLENAALEEDETLQQVWARLIANSTDPTFKQPLHPGFIEVIKQMSADEVILLQSFFKSKRRNSVFGYSEVFSVFENMDKLKQNNAYKKRQFTAFNKIFILGEEHAKKLTLRHPEQIEVYIDNLVRLRILELGYKLSTNSERHDVENSEGDTVGSVRVNETEQDEYLRFTEFGRSLMEACMRDAV